MNRHILTIVVFAAAVTALGIPATAGTPIAGASSPTCDGKVATIVAMKGQTTITGTSGDDVIVGGPRTLTAIDGLGGDDTICGGPHRQTINGGDGADVLIGDSGQDVLMGGNGDDTLEGKGGMDKLSGGPGDDVERGGAGDDAFGVDPGDDRIVGNPADQPVGCGHYNFDEIDWSSNQWLPTVDGPATVDLGAGTATGPGIGHDSLTRIGRVHGSITGGDHLTGGPCTDMLIAEGPNSEVAGAGGDDLVDGGDDADSTSGGDILSGGPGDDTIGVSDERTGSSDLPTSIDGGAGTDTAQFGGVLALVEVRVDLTQGTMTTPTTAGTVSGIENTELYDGIVEGDDQANFLLVGGGALDDEVAKAYGEGGDDTVIALGPGDTLADGGDGTDACEGPNQVNCESQFTPDMQPQP